jgi:hypothetical protein
VNMYIRFNCANYLQKRFQVIMVIANQNPDCFSDMYCVYMPGVLHTSNGPRHYNSNDVQLDGTIRSFFLVAVLQSLLRFRRVAYYVHKYTQFVGTIHKLT